MPRYLFEASYTLDGVRGIQGGGGSARRDAMAQTVESVGGKLISLDFAFGSSDDRAPHTGGGRRRRAAVGALPAPGQ